jgi:hypothetical protein
MASADITLGEFVATIEVDETQRTLTKFPTTCEAILVNAGPSDVYVRDDAGTVQADDAQREREVILPIGGSMRVRHYIKSLTYKCKAGLTAVVGWLPAPAED